MVTAFEATISSFNKTDENKKNLFPHPAIAGHCFSRRGSKTINKLHKLLEPRSQNDIQLHVELNEKRNLKLKKEFSLAVLDTHKK